MLFGSAVVLVSIFARSFKEAQNYIAPLQFIMILPAMAGMLPGLEMNWKYAFVPLVNLSLLSKEFLKGDTNWGYYFATLLSCLFLAALCIAYAAGEAGYQYQPILIGGLTIVGALVQLKAFSDDDE